MKSLRKLLLEKNGKRPPFLKAPLNAPGASLRDKLDDKVDSFAFGILSGPLGAGVLALLRPILKPGISLSVLIALTFTAWLLWLIFVGRKLLEEIRTTRLGYLGEVLIGQELELTRACGCSVYHDIISEKPDKEFNIDHVLIGEVGIFVFETKTKSKPIKGETKIWYQNGDLLFSTGGKSRSELDQALRNGKYIQDIILQLINDSNKVSLQHFTSRNPVPLRSCLVFPGWHVDYISALGFEVSLSNDDMLSNFIKFECDRNKRLSPKEAADLNEIFDDYLRKRKEYLIEV